MTRRSVGGAARGPITPSASSSLAVSIPFEPSTPIRRLRSLLAIRDRLIQSANTWSTWWKEPDYRYVERMDVERRMIRERIKQLSHERKLSGQ